MKTLIASHRGGLFLWPENSPRAFRESVALGVDQAECDVHLTADGVPVVMHDATLDRTSDGRGPVSALTVEAFSRLRLRGAAGEAPPTLAGYLDILAATAVVPRVEIKSDAMGHPYPGLVEATLAALDRSGQRGRSWVIGFHAPTMAAVQRAGGVAGVAWLLETRTLRDIGVDGLLAAARAYGFAEIGLPEAAIDAALVARLRQAGVGIGSWGANHAASIRRMLELGIDVFATDDPPLALRLRQAR